MKYKPLFATRLNSFAVLPELFWKKGKKITSLDLIERASTVNGLSHVDLNFPDHFQSVPLLEMKKILIKKNLILNSIAMRYNSSIFSGGAFTHPDWRIRQKAIDLTYKGMDAVMKLGGKLLTIWPGPDGYDYPFQADYSQLYEYFIDGMKKVANYNKTVHISIEYKHSDPRAKSVLPNIGTTLLAISDIGLPQIGVTIDFCHSLAIKENPASCAQLAIHKDKLYGIHLNDGYGDKDDGLMPGSIHFLQTIELLYTLAKSNYQYAIYFDTFPQYIDPVTECSKNISFVKGLLKKMNRIPIRVLETVIAKQDIISAHKILGRTLI